MNRPSTWHLLRHAFRWLALLLASCAVADPAGRWQTGEASYYSDHLHGRPTASGRPYDRNGLTAAHPTLPFGTIVRVTHLQNGRVVQVTVHDRLSHPRRVIDLSYAAAWHLGMIQQGVAPVRLEVLSTPAGTPVSRVSTSQPLVSTRTPGEARHTTTPALAGVMIVPSAGFHEAYEVQLAAFHHLHEAHALQWQMYHRGIATRSDYRGRRTALHRVLAEPVFATQADATAWAFHQQRQGIIPEALVIPRGC